VLLFPEHRSAEIISQKIGLDEYNLSIHHPLFYYSIFPSNPNDRMDLLFTRGDGHVPADCCGISLFKN
jgi:hypothetical protein